MQLEELTAGQSTTLKVRNQVAKATAEGKTEQDHIKELLSAQNMLR